MFQIFSSKKASPAATLTKQTNDSGETELNFGPIDKFARSRKLKKNQVWQMVKHGEYFARAKEDGIWIYTKKSDFDNDYESVIQLNQSNSTPVKTQLSSLKDLRVAQSAEINTASEDIQINKSELKTKNQAALNSIEEFWQIEKNWQEKPQKRSGASAKQPNQNASAMKQPPISELEAEILELKEQITDLKMLNQILMDRQ